MHPESMSLTASKLMLKRFRELLESNKSFAFETTASATNYIKHLKKAQVDGYEVHLVLVSNRQLTFLSAQEYPL
jgi:predicted ABC-type ATPase